jgi:hypothetical protein
MRSLCWKELRENLKWALLAMVVLGIAAMYALYVEPDNGYENGVTICKLEFQAVTTFGCAAVGLMLGLLQILPELRRDQWASLLHRPVSRGVIFLGKALAGLLLYALATLPPFLLCLWLVATPGHFPSPFVPGMALPGIADICAGLVYYFAALALALQRGKWVGLRAFPLLAAFHCSALVLFSPAFHTAIEAVGLMALLLFAAAWGTMLHQEKFSARPWLARLAFLAMVFYGACGLGDFARAILFVAGPSPHTRSSIYTVSESGLPMRLNYDDNDCVSITGLDGKPVTGSEFSRVLSHSRMMGFITSSIGVLNEVNGQPFLLSYRASEKYLSVFTAYERPRIEQWFYVDPENSLLCYQVPQKTLVARFDQAGFQPPSAQPHPFLPHTIWRGLNTDCLVFWDGNTLRFVSLARRENTNLPLQGAGPVFGIGTTWAQDTGGNPLVFGVALLDRLAVYDAQSGALLATLPYHYDMDRWGQLRLGLNGSEDRFYLWYLPSPWIDDITRAAMPSYIGEMDRQGQLLRTWTLPPLPPPAVGFDLGDFLAQRLQTPAFFFGGMAWQKLGALLGSRQLASDLATRFTRDLRLTEQIALCITILSLALAAITLFWTRRAYFSWPRACAWAAFVFAFNLAGFIAFRLVADWPPLTPCPRCRRPRPIHDDLCPHCAAPWPIPETGDLEVFDHAPAAAAA